MPATITHAYFAKDVFEILPDDIRITIDFSRIKMFGQSTDPLMFYNIFSVMSGKEVRKYQHIFHTTKTQEFFINMLSFIKTNKIDDDMDVRSFVAGFICHYVLDSNVHPFVFYKTGKFDKTNPMTYKYNNVHAFMETFIDNDTIKRREKTNPYKFNIGKFCFNTRCFSNKLNAVIDYSFYKTYKWKNMSKIYYKSIKQMKFALNTFRRDPYGLKRNCYKFIDTFTPKKVFRFEAISYHYPLKDRHNFLNLEHKLWRNPTTYDLTSTESFVDLYLKSVKFAKVLICASFDYLDGKDIELEKLFTNKSYITGLDCNEEKELKYFEY